MMACRLFNEIGPHRLRIWKLFLVFCIIFLAILSGHLSAEASAPHHFWSPAKGIEIERLASMEHYRIFGRQSGSWRFAHIKGHTFNLVPGQKYRLQAWVKVNSTSFHPGGPFLKIELYKGLFFQKNINTPKYKLSEGENWQLLTREFEAPQWVSFGVIALEKGTKGNVEIEMEVKMPEIKKISSFSPVHRYKEPTSGQQLKNHVACTHPCLHLSAATIVALREKVNSAPYSRFWSEIKQKAQRYIRETPPIDISNLDDNQIRHFGDKLPYISLAYLVTGESEYLEGAKLWIRSLTRYPNWASNRDIGAAHLIYGLSLSYDWLYQDLSEEERMLIRGKVRTQAEKIYKVLVNEEMGWATNFLNNHNYTNVMSLGVAGLVFGSELPEAASWRQAAKINFSKVLSVLSPDGASHEGVGYWGYGMDSLLKYYDGVVPKSGIEDLRESGYFRNGADYRLYMSLPGYDQNANYADSPVYDWYGPSYLLSKLAILFQDGHAQWLANKVRAARNRKVGASWLDLIWYDSALEPLSPEKKPLIHHFSNLDIVVYRSDWSKKATWFLYKAGYPQGKKAVSMGIYEGGHIHPDAGSFLLWADGEWLVVDDGVVSLKLTGEHNTIIFNGSGQYGEGKKFFDSGALVQKNIGAEISSVSFDGIKLTIESSLSRSYPDSIKLSEWNRTLEVRKNGVEVNDKLLLENISQIDLMLHFPNGSISRWEEGLRFISLGKKELCIRSRVGGSIASDYSMGSTVNSSRENRMFVLPFAIRQKVTSSYQLISNTIETELYWNNNDKNISCPQIVSQRG